MKIETKYDLGDRVKDKITGYKGLIMVVAVYSTGCVHYGVSPETMVEKDTEISDPNWMWHDETRWELVKKHAVIFPQIEGIDYGTDVEKEKSTSPGQPIPQHG